MKELKVTIWNGDVLTVPVVNDKYCLKSVFLHMKLSLRCPNSDLLKEGMRNE